MHTSRRSGPFILPFFLLCIVLSGVTSIAQAETEKRTDTKPWKLVEERFYVLEIGDARAGDMTEQVHDNGEQYRTSLDTKMAIKRGSITIDIRITEQFIETHDGMPVELQSTTVMSQQPTTTRWIFYDDHVESIAVQGGREKRTKLPRPEEGWLTPMAVSRFVKVRLKAGAEEYAYSTLSAEGGIQPITVTATFVGKETLEWDGRDIPVTVWHESNSMMPSVKSTAKYSSDGIKVHEVVPMPGLGEITTRLVSKEEAHNGGDGAVVPEVMVSMFIKPDRPLPGIDHASTLTMRIRAKEGTLPVIPSAGVQRVEMAEDRTSALVTLDMHARQAAPSEDAANESFLEASSLIDAGDSLIVKLADRATRDAGDDPMKQALALREFVEKHISNKGLSTGFASASETARMREGDCSEHGVLLCALLRAKKIPARVASGLVFVEEIDGGVFGWHMWTQALIDGRWVDLDATLDVPYHPGHLLTGATAMAEGGGSAELNALMLLIGNLDIEIVDVKYERK
jgi:hypothetical protein